MEEHGFSQLARQNPEAMMPAAASFYDAGRFSAVERYPRKAPRLSRFRNFRLRFHIIA